VTLTVVANLSSSTVELDLAVGGELLLVTGGAGTDSTHLKPWEARIYRRAVG